MIPVPSGVRVWLAVGPYGHDGMDAPREPGSG
jgi:hypothetical protein